MFGAAMLTASMGSYCRFLRLRIRSHDSAPHTPVAVIYPLVLLSWFALNNVSVCPWIWASHRWATC